MNAELPENSSSAAGNSTASGGIVGSGGWRSRLFAPVDIAPLVWFRIAFGLIMAWEVWRYFDHAWISCYFVEPKFYFTYYGFSWVHPWPGQGMHWHFAGLGALALAIAAGFFYRVASVLFFLGFTYVFLLDQTRYLNHFYLVCLYAFLLMFVPAHRAFAVDARRPERRAGTVPAWTLWVLRAQIGVVYFMGGVAKLNWDWLRGQPMKMWLGERTDFPIIGKYFVEDWVPYAFSYGGLLFDLGIAVLVLWRRTRWLGFGLATIFNFMNARLFHIGIFPWLALGATVLLFISPKWLPEPWPELWKGPQGGPSAGPPPAAWPWTRRQQWTVGLLGAWLAFQVLVPLRHLVFYPGNPEWTEEGHRFAWRMKLRSKDASIRIVARDPATDRSHELDPLTFVTERQLKEMLDRPDMVLQLAHHVAREWRREHGTPLEVRMRVKATLNGRAEQLLIDPGVDLAAQPRNLRPASWIKSLTTPLETATQDNTLPAQDASAKQGLKSIPTRRRSPESSQQ